jgi:hypothetical protein
MQNIGGDNITGEIKVTKGTSKYEGWGTALKPAHEPIVMARKPLSEKTVVQNVLEWGTGGINIDESRVGYSDNDDPRISKGYEWKNKAEPFGESKTTQNKEGWNKQGRFPANIIFDEEAGRILDEQSEGGASRFFYCPKTSKKDRNEGLENLDDKYYAAGNQAKAELKRGNTDFNANKGKGRDERHNHNQVGVSKNNHPTVKPTDLMLYLIRLVTPKDGTTLDPFMGSGSTGKAAVRGGFDFIGIERENEYMAIAEARIKYEIENPLEDNNQLKIF